MKSVLISIQPKWWEKIASGEKADDVRKTRPNMRTPFKCYIYETQGKTETPWMDEDGHMIFRGRGMVVGEFVCDMVDIFTPTEKGVKFQRFYALFDTCLSLAEIRAYLGGKVGYGWHISNLVIYDKPKPLSDFYTWKKCNSCKTSGYEASACTYDDGCKVPVVLKRPPQSWCYVEEMKND